MSDAVLVEDAAGVRTITRNDLDRLDGLTEELLQKRAPGFEGRGPA